MLGKAEEKSTYWKIRILAEWWQLSQKEQLRGKLRDRQVTDDRKDAKGFLTNKKRFCGQTAFFFSIFDRQIFFIFTPTTTKHQQKQKKQPTTMSLLLKKQINPFSPRRYNIIEVGDKIYCLRQIDS